MYVGYAHVLFVCTWTSTRDLVMYTSRSWILKKPKDFDELSSSLELHLHALFVSTLWPDRLHRKERKKREEEMNRKTNFFLLCTNEGRYPATTRFKRRRRTTSAPWPKIMGCTRAKLFRRPASKAGTVTTAPFRVWRTPALCPSARPAAAPAHPGDSMPLVSTGISITPIAKPEKRILSREPFLLTISVLLGSPFFS